MERDRKSTRLNSSHLVISYAVFCLKKKNKIHNDLQTLVLETVDYTYIIVTDAIHTNLIVIIFSTKVHLTDYCIYKLICTAHHRSTFMNCKYRHHNVLRHS